MVWSEHPLLPLARTQVSPPQLQVSWARNRSHKNATKKDTRGGQDQDYKKKWQHNEANNSTKLININNTPLFKSTVYVCHSNIFITPPLNSRHNDAAIDSGCSTHTWPLTAPVHNFQKTVSSTAINLKLPNDQLMTQSHHVTVLISYMPSSTQHVKIFPDHS